MKKIIRILHFLQPYQFTQWHIAKSLHWPRWNMLPIAGQCIILCRCHQPN